MSTNLAEEIKEVEAESKKIVAEAKSEAAKIVADARNESEKKEKEANSKPFVITGIRFQRLKTRQRKKHRK